MSTAPTSTPAFQPNVAIAFDAPGFLEPLSRMSMFLRLPRMYAVLKHPKRYEPMKIAIQMRMGLNINISFQGVIFLPLDI